MRRSRLSSHPLRPSDTPSGVRRRRGAVGFGQLLAVVLVLGTTIAVVKRSIDHNADPANVVTREAGITIGGDTAAQSAPTPEQTIGAFKVRNLQGKIVPVATKGQASIVMVSSVTCSWCKRALKDLGELSAGRPLPRLKLLTLEGAAEGAPMLAKEGITGAELIGPAGSSDQVLLTFRYPGTPTFVAIDRNGRVVRTMPGYPIRQEMEHWFAVMVGDAETP